MVKTAAMVTAGRGMLSLFVGRMLGVIIGIFVEKLLRPYINLPAVLSADSALKGLFLSLITGTIFGVYPACKAAKMTPVDALRHE